MNEAVLNQYQKAPRTWIVKLIVVLILVTLVAWSGTTIELSKIPENGAEISKKYYQRDFFHQIQHFYLIRQIKVSLIFY